MKEQDFARAIMAVMEREHHRQRRRDRVRFRVSLSFMLGVVALLVIVIESLSRA